VSKTKPRKKRAKTKTASAKIAHPPSKRAFIESLPRTTPARDVVAAARARGITISANYVYVLRQRARRSSTRGAGARAPLGRITVRRSGDSPAAMFVQLVLDLGLARSRALLSTMEARIEDLVAGR